MDFAHHALAGSKQCIERHGLGRHALEVVLVVMLDVAVAGPASSVTLAGANAAALAFTITNTGNGPEAFRLTVDAAVAGNDFDVVVDQLALDSNGNGVFDDGVDQVLAAGADTPVINADASVTVFVLVTLPVGASDGQLSQLRLTASALTGTGTPGTRSER